MRDVHLGSLEREEAEAAFSRYVLYLESTIVVLNIDYSPRENINLYVYVRPSHPHQKLLGVSLHFQSERESQ